MFCYQILSEEKRSYKKLQRRFSWAASRLILAEKPFGACLGERLIFSGPPKFVYGPNRWGLVVLDDVALPLWAGCAQLVLKITVPWSCQHQTPEVTWAQAGRISCVVISHVLRDRESLASSGC